jgi:hypothetical protein
LVGAPRPDRPEGREVGLGAFSLRSRRLLGAAAGVLGKLVPGG